MADSFFEFNTSLTVLGLDDAPDLDEEEYDALNQETFGENAFQGDWEEDHTRFAEVTENSRVYRNSLNSEKDDDLDLEVNLCQLVLEESDEEEEDGLNSVKHKTSKSINIPDKFKLESSGVYNSSPIWSIYSPKKDDISLTKQLQQAVQPSPSKSSSMHFLPPQIPRIPTVQELERDLIQKNKQNKQSLEKDGKSNDLYQILQGKNFQQNVNQQQNLSVSNSNAIRQNTKSKFTYSVGNNKCPPGFSAHQRAPFLQQPQQQDMVMLRYSVNTPMMVCPRLMPPYLMPNPYPVILPQMPPMVLPPYQMRFMPVHPVLMQQQQQQQQQQQLLHIQQNKMQTRSNHGEPDGQKNNSRYSSNSNNIGHGMPWMQSPDRRGAGDFDEYAGLMNDKERQWVRNIQLIQLTTDKPHVDDYYFKAWLKKKENELKKKDDVNEKVKREQFVTNKQTQTDVGRKDRKDSERDLTATPSPRVYVPLQFENSLGKIQRVSITAPRKMIDLDVVSEPQQEATPLPSHRDSRKTKKILLELERLYLMAMEIEDIDNNVAEVEQHSTKPELIDKIISSFLCEERFVNFMCVRKGKTLLLRILKHLDEAKQNDQLSDLWCRVMKSLSTIVRRDQNDGLLLQIYPFFKKWISTATYVNLSSLASFFLPANASNHVKGSSRAVSPSSGKSVLSVALASKFGVSVISCILSQGEVVYPTLDDKEQLDWTTLIFNFMKHMTSIPNLENIPTPLDPLPAAVSTSILNRSTGLHIQDYASAKRALNYFQ